MEDAQKILSYFKTLTPTENRNIVLVGGSFISMEAVCYFVENAEKANNIVISRSKPFENVFGRDVANKIQQFHESKGVKFVVESNFDIVEFNESKTNPGHLGSFVYKKEGSTTASQDADICILAIGGVPATEFLQNTEIKMNEHKYVIVDHEFKTSVDDVYAIGDIVTFPFQSFEGLKPDEPHVNIQHWSVACNHGRAAGLTLLNQNRNEKLKNELKFVPFFWTTQFKKSIRFAGYNKKYDSIVFHEDTTKQNPFKFAAFYLNKDVVVGVTTLDWDPVCALYAEALHNDVVVKREHVSKDPMDLKQFMN